MFLTCPTLLCGTRRKLQTPGAGKEHKRQGTPTLRCPARRRLRRGQRRQRRRFASTRIASPHACPALTSNPLSVQVTYSTFSFHTDTPSFHAETHEGGSDGIGSITAGSTPRNTTDLPASGPRNYFVPPPPGSVLRVDTAVPPFKLCSTFGSTPSFLQSSLAATSDTVTIMMQSDWSDFRRCTSHACVPCSCASDCLART